MEQILVNASPAIIAVLVPLVIAAFKKLVSNLPGWSLPVIALVLGPAFDLALGQIAGIPSTGWAGALAGLAGVGIREIKDQAQQALRS